MKKIVQGIAAGVAVSLSLGLTTNIQAADFSGKRIEWVIPFKEGGGGDTWARFFLPRISEKLPGQPSIVIKNVPGGGSINGANQFAARAKGTGLEVFGSSASTLFPYLLDDKRVKYNPREWSAIFATPSDGVFYVRPELGVTSAKELGKLKGQKLLFASLGPTSLDLVPLLSMDILGMDVKPVFGMDRAAGRLAFERGEVNLDYQTTSSYLQKTVPLVEEGKAIPIMTWGVLDEDGNIVRDPSFPDLPTFPEVYEMLNGKKLEGQKFDVWKTFFVAGYAAQKIMMLPSSAPQDVVQTWRKALAETVKEADFRAAAAQSIGDYDQIVGERAQVALEIILNLSDENKKWIQNWLTQKYGVKF